jgi:hypothetical protein
MSTTCLLDEVDFYGLQDLHDKLIAQREGETQKKTEHRLHVVGNNVNFLSKRARSEIEIHEKDGWKVQCRNGGAGHDFDPLLIVFVTENC